MELVLLWLVFAVFAMIGASQKNRSGVGWFFIGLLLGPFGLLVYLMPKATVPDVEGYAAREEYERRKRDRMDMSKLSSSRSDTE
jgi:hypothetical protein